MVFNYLFIKLKFHGFHLTTGVTRTHPGITKVQIHTGNNRIQQLTQLLNFSSFKQFELDNAVKIKLVEKSVNDTVKNFKAFMKNSNL